MNFNAALSQVAVAVVGTFQNSFIDPIPLFMCINYVSDNLAADGFLFADDVKYILSATIATLYDAH